MESTRILVTGPGGQVGGALLKVLAPLGEVVAVSRAEMDLRSADSIRAAIRRVEPRWIINPAAYTAVDKAESEPEEAHAVNAVAPGVMAEEAARLGAGLVHFSTDYVFDGSKPGPYVETDAPAPLNTYGRTKLAGEQAVAAAGCAHAILRTSWVYGATGKNFLLTILRVARERPELRIVADQHGAPTTSGVLAGTVAHLLQRESPGSLRERSGIYHACCTGETTWFGFASLGLERLAQAEPEATLARLIPIPGSDYPTPAARPTNSRMSTRKLQETFGYTPPAWDTAANQVMDTLLGR